MARGWESKSVESQQTEPQPTQVRKQLSAEELEKARKREGLELSRGRVVRELETARSGVHRTALENALRFLDEELAKLQ
jgi:RNA polymerase-interacting CarD/CdnL/TRCF family regulator